ncbi:MAG: hypothetical protein LC754_07360 [Acidobacteria bacterium]|nr:hypothetical protein [Acidobacteriota bacterium]
MLPEMQASTRLELQIKTSKLIGLGFVLSIARVGGFGSLAAFIIGLRARDIIRRSHGEIIGLRMAWWCIIVGGLGAATLLPYVIWLIVKAVPHG